MAVAIRLTRVGATKRPAYRVVAIERRRSRDGRALEILGFYDPLTEPATVRLETARIQAWIGKGAQPSETVAKLIRQYEREAAAAASGTEVEKPRRATRATKPKASSKAAAKAKARAEAPAEEAPAAEASPVVADEPVEAPATEEAPAGESADAAADEAMTATVTADEPVAADEADGATATEEAAAGESADAADAADAAEKAEA
ncbi:MAG TPA: 30S ribosomal protein S16 [Candidatus Binatia bacterium]|nr:30S ribosomal protein S16 [Candidatus Binatia bacterium]